MCRPKLTCCCSLLLPRACLRMCQPKLTCCCLLLLQGGAAAEWQLLVDQPLVRLSREITPFQARFKDSFPEFKKTRLNELGQAISAHLGVTWVMREARVNGATKDNRLQAASAPAALLDKAAHKKRDTGGAVAPTPTSAATAGARVAVCGCVRLYVCVHALVCLTLR